MTAADKVITAFGGPAKTGAALGFSVQRVCHWKKTGIIPPQVQAHILQKAKELKKKLKAQDLVNC